MRFSIRISILQTFALLLILTVVSIAAVFYSGSSRIMVDLYSLLARVQADKLIERTVAFIEAPGHLTRMTATAFEDTPIVGEHANPVSERRLYGHEGGLASLRPYVPAELVRQLIATGREAKLGGEKVLLAIMFTDIVGFTALSEIITAEELMLQLSTYLDRLTRIIEKEQGTVDKYIGDAIMAFWGAPREVENPALLACRAALSCSKAVADLNHQWRAEEKPAMPTCFGIHFGETIVGNVGSSQRMNYSIFGDNVNLASRLEGINRIYGTKIIVSQSVYEAVDKQMICRPLDIVAVKGKKKSIATHELPAAKDEDGAEALASFCARFAEGIDEYRRQEWERALAVFEMLQEESPNDHPVKLYIKRCRNIIDGSVTVLPDWDGSVIMNAK